MAFVNIKFQFLQVICLRPWRAPRKDSELTAIKSKSNPGRSRALRLGPLPVSYIFLSLNPRVNSNGV